MTDRRRPRKRQFPENGSSRDRGGHRRGKIKGVEIYASLTCKVGFGLFLVGWTMCHVRLLIASPATTTDGGLNWSRRWVEGGPLSDAKTTTLPNFRLDSSSSTADAYGIARAVAKRCGNNSTERRDVDAISNFRHDSDLLRGQFSARYGGEVAARHLLHSSVTTFRSVGDGDERTGIVKAALAGGCSDGVSTGLTPPLRFPAGLTRTAERLLEARQSKRPFRLSFGGYSVTAGRGNYFHQSFPFVVERLLSGPSGRLGITLEIRNAAVGGVPSFPYGWCLENFLGVDADAASWDYGMNEPGGAADGFEAYLRRVLTMERRPMMIVKDASDQIAGDRRRMLQRYVETGALSDPIIVSIDDAVEPFLRLCDDVKPPGFRDWKKFGAPNGAPGQARHHPGVAEHELIGWVIAMHFLAALEIVSFVVSMVDGTGIEEVSRIEEDRRRPLLPPPFTEKGNMSADLYSVLYGSESNVLGTWVMNPVHCRTTFDPILTGGLSELIVSGSVGEDIDLMLPKGSEFYNRGWVLDLGKGEKAAKRKLKRFGGLGFVDSKKAYYGIYASGPLNLIVPCQRRKNLSSVARGEGLTTQKSSVGPLPQTENARECFRSLIACEVNAKRESGECNLQSDLSFHVGGERADGVKPIATTGTSYWGRSICLQIEIPHKARMSQWQGHLGVEFTIALTSQSVLLRSGPCSISHVVWVEQME